MTPRNRSSKASRSQDAESRAKAIELQQQVQLLKEAEYLKASQSLYNYLIVAWQWFDPAPFKSNWHLEAICDHVQACFEGEFLDLVVTVPPRCCKSSIISVAFPTWAWGPAGYPETKFITAAYNDRLATRDAVKSRRLLLQPWYRTGWGKEFDLLGDTNQKTRYENNKNGYRISTSVRGLGTGEGYDVLIVDDALNARNANSEAELEALESWWGGTMSTRKNDVATSRTIVIGQRLTERDLPGLAIASGDYVHLNLPMEYEPKTFVYSPLAWQDPRKEEGEVLWKERFPPKELEKLKKKLGPYGTAAQLQQRPSPASGGLIKVDEWLRYYGTLPDDLEAWAIAWDTSVTDFAHSDYSVGQCWGRKGSSLYLIDQVRKKMGIEQLLPEMIRFRNKFPYVNAVLIEVSANGQAAIDMLKKRVPGITPVYPQKEGGSKEARLAALVPEFAAGNVILPMKEYNPWVESFIHELRMFPKGSNDDTIDAAVYAISYLLKNYRVVANLEGISEEMFARANHQFSEYRHFSEQMGGRSSRSAIRKIWEI